MRFVPRLFVDAPLSNGATLPLTDDHFGYLSRVLRMNSGDSVLLFNGRDGEYTATLTLAKRDGTTTCIAQTRTQPPVPAPVILAVAHLKPDPMALVCEKATELGATHIQPIIFDQSTNRAGNERRLMARMVEAAEQSERLTVPELLPPMRFADWLGALPQGRTVVAAVERADAPAPLPAILPLTDIAFLVGPEGGLSQTEKHSLSTHPQVRCVCLGANILRAETAAIVLLGVHSVS